MATGFLASAFLFGCASQGPLRPPSLHLPGPVRGLTAERIGPSVDLRWTNPSRTTDGLDLGGRHVPQPLRVEICRVEQAASICLPGPTVSGGTGQTQTFSDALPPAESAGSARPLQYRVRVVNGDGKGGTYVAVDSVAGEAPQPPGQATAELVADGVLLRWQPAPDGGSIQLRVQRGAVGSGSAGQAGPLAAKRVEDVLLAVDKAGMDAGGVLDPGARPGTAQQYLLSRTRTVPINGKDLLLSSPVVRVAIGADAKLPAPAVPTGLEAVASTLTSPEIDLVWQPVAGAVAYIVYRADGSGAHLPLMTRPVTSLSFTDHDVHAGVRYRYSVAAVGPDGTAGARSAEVTESMPSR